MHFPTKLMRFSSFLVVFSFGVALGEPTGCYQCNEYPNVTKLFDLSDFGGIGDGKTLNTDAFRKCIDAAASAGGGRVVVGGGHYLTGTVQLKTNVFLDLAANATILASTDPNDYPEDPNDWIVISGQGISNTGIVGNGMIHGQAVPGFFDSYSLANDQLQPIRWTGSKYSNCSGECRPKLVVFEQCSHVLVRDVLLVGSADWTSRYLECENVLVDNVTVLGHHQWPNNDGIDPDSSTNVTIRNCFVDVGDDAICPKASTSLPMQNLVVENCTVRSRSSGFKIGSSTVGNVQDILVRNLRVLAGSNRGLGIQHRDGGNLSNVYFENIVIEQTTHNPLKCWGDGEPFWITTVPRTDGATVGTVSNIYFSNIFALSSINSAFISSRSPTPIKNVQITNSILSYSLPAPPRQGLVYAPIGHDYRPNPSSIPEIVPFPINGVYLEHALDTILSNVTFRMTSPAQTCINGTSDSLQSLNSTKISCNY